MKTKKKWGWSKKIKFKCFRKMFIHSYPTLYKIYNDEFIWDELRPMIFGNCHYRGEIPSDCKVIESRKYRMKSKQELRKIIKNNEIDNDVFPILVKNKKYYYY
jgi:hypothetical protein